MQGGRGRGDPFGGFGDPFGGFGDMRSLFGGRDPFDDPFFTQPLGGMLQPSLFGHAGNPFMGTGTFGSSLFGPSGSPFMDEHAAMLNERRQFLPDSSRGPIIEELNSDDEKEEPEARHSKKKNPYKHVRSARQPYVEQPDDGTEGRELMQTQYGNQFSVMHDRRSRPQAHSVTFESSSVTIGGSNGRYYTSSTTRRAGSDGVRFEEHKEADSVTGEAAHRISRGIYDKGHTLSRHMKSDGEVDTKQVLHNINEEELAGFEEAWKGKARKHLPGAHAHGVGEASSNSRGGWALEGTNEGAGGRNVESSRARRRR